MDSEVNFVFAIQSTQQVIQYWDELKIRSVAYEGVVKQNYLQSLSFYIRFIFMSKKYFCIDTFGYGLELSKE